MWGVPLPLELQVNSSERVLCILGMSQFCITSLRYSCPPMTFGPQSDQQTFGWPRRYANRRNAIKKASDDLLVMSSKWTALVVVQVNITTGLLEEFSVSIGSASVRTYPLRSWKMGEIRLPLANLVVGPLTDRGAFYVVSGTRHTCLLRLWAFSWAR